jgi:hypothetical protein
MKALVLISMIALISIGCATPYKGRTFEKVQKQRLKQTKRSLPNR